MSERQSVGRMLDDLRSKGWAVAVHNDYRQDGESFTFWLFTKGRCAVRGEGRTDLLALADVAATAEISEKVAERQRIDREGLEIIRGQLSECGYGGRDMNVVQQVSQVLLDAGHTLANDYMGGGWHREAKSDG